MSVLVELFIRRFSPECILKLVQDERLSVKSLQDAVLFYFGHENEVGWEAIATLTWKNQFIQYVAATPMSDAVSELIDNILRRVDVNQYNGGSRANDGRVLYIRETLLQMVLRQFLKKANGSQEDSLSKKEDRSISALMYVITHLLEHPHIDVNRKNSDGISTIEYLAFYDLETH